MNAWLCVQEILAGDYEHRKGWRPSTRSFDDVVDAMYDEIEELRVAVMEGDRSHVIEELADVTACVYHMAIKLQLQPHMLDAEVQRKLRLRFNFPE